MEARPLLELLELAVERERLETESTSLARESGLRLANARRAVGLSQSAFAVLANVSQPYVSQIEKGVKSVSSSQLQEFHRLLAIEAKKTTTQGGRRVSNSKRAPSRA